MPYPFPNTFDLSPDEPLEAQLAKVPGKWVVYLMTDVDDRPVQMLAVKNLRASLRRRLTQTPEEIASRRIDYRAIVRHVHYIRVDSTLECDLMYFELARQIFPATFRTLLPDRSAWFVHVDPSARFPRYTKTSDLTLPTGQLLGPIAEKHSAQKLVETMEDLFDLCRYHHILVQSPSGKPCAYKEMGKCPAPCDGSVSLEQYRQLVQLSLDVLIDPVAEIDAQTCRMTQAARDLQFESASRIKQFITALESLRKKDWKHLRPLEDLQFLAVCPGEKKSSVKHFLLSPAIFATLNPAALPTIPPLDRSTLDDIAALRLMIWLPHMLSPKDCVLIPHDQITAIAITEAERTVLKQKIDPETVDEEEHAVRETPTM